MAVRPPDRHQLAPQRHVRREFSACHDTRSLPSITSRQERRYRDKEFVDKAFVEEVCHQVRPAFEDDESGVGHLTNSLKDVTRAYLAALGDRAYARSLDRAFFG